MKRSLSRRLFGAMCMFLMPFAIAVLFVIGWIGLIVNELRGR